jgi:outer membrane biosynthesis protein TonB
MISEVPIEPAEPVDPPEVEPVDPPEVEPQSVQAEQPEVQIEVVDEEFPKKKAPRPKAAPKPKVAKPKAEPKAAKPKAEPKAAKQPKARATAPTRPPSPVSSVVGRFETLSSMDMVAELLHRRGHQERENKRLLYKSFLS